MSKEYTNPLLNLGPGVYSSNLFPNKIIGYKKVICKCRRKKSLGENVLKHFFSSVPDNPTHTIERLAEIVIKPDDKAVIVKPFPQTSSIVPRYSVSSFFVNLIWGKSQSVPEEFDDKFSDKFRTNKFTVTHIEEDEKYENVICSSLMYRDYTYEIGKTYRTNELDINLDNLHANGLHFFLSERNARRH